MGFWPPPFQAVPVAAPPGMTMSELARDWPLQDSMELCALVTAVPCARLHVRQVLWEWGLTELMDSAELIVSELMSNAVAASAEVEQATFVRLWLLSDKERLLIFVWDANPKPPVSGALDVDAEKGRGLLLVAASSTRWGAYPAPDVGGKAVWAEIGRSGEEARRV